MIYFEDQVYEYSEIQDRILNNTASEKDRRFVAEALRVVFYEDDGVTVASEKLELLLVNDAYADIVGIDAKYLIGQITTQLVKQGVLERSVAEMALNNRGPVTVTQHQKNGKTVMNTGKPVIGADGQVERVVSIIRDMPFLKALYDDLVKQKKLLEDYKQTLTLKDMRDNGKIIARSNEMRDVVTFAEKVAANDSTVLILGESGVGKGVVADLIHSLSRRSENHKMFINCGAIPEQLLESELFGYTKGAFTGANREGKVGLIEAAEGGTVILDEIGEMPLSLQPKLLSFMETGCITKVGSTETKEVDSRVIAITNRDLEKMVEQGKFREDLYYRLNVIPILVPPLRERREDIIPLILMFLDRFNRKSHSEKTVAPEVLAKMQNYDWPGNIRELRNMLERLVVLSTGNEISERDLRTSELRNDVQPTMREIDWPVELTKITKSIEDNYIEQAMAKGGSIREAAKLLKISPSMLYRKMNRE